MDLLLTLPRTPFVGLNSKKDTTRFPVVPFLCFAALYIYMVELRENHLSVALVCCGCFLLRQTILFGLLFRSQECVNLFLHLFLDSLGNAGSFAFVFLERLIRIDDTIAYWAHIFVAKKYRRGWKTSCPAS